jgi:hypothetical protein
MKHKTTINSRNERGCVIPAKAGISYSGNEIPAFAGMTGHCNSFGLMHNYKR